MPWVALVLRSFSEAGRAKQGGMIRAALCIFRGVELCVCVHSERKPNVRLPPAFTIPPRTVLRRPDQRSEETHCRSWLIEEHPRLTDRLIEYGQVLPDDADFLFYSLLTGVTEAINACFYLRRNLL